ncbi:MAG: hypothetical protein C0490_20135 [Marivirga sp.]|nr:hypothetical protein [Marivirga sp.]
MNQSMDNPNEKLIVVKGPKEEQMKKVLEKFCEMYNQNGSTTILKFYKKGDDTFFITFPSDIDFELFCYLINYIKYPMDINYKVEAIGWTIADHVDSWNTKYINGKKVIVFIDPDDQEYDNVMLTTEDNAAYEIGFAMGEGLEPRNKMILDFRTHDINLADLRNANGTTVK